MRRRDKPAMRIRSFLVAADRSVSRFPQPAARTARFARDTAAELPVREVSLAPTSDMRVQVSSAVSFDRSAKLFDVGAVRSFRVVVQRFEPEPPPVRAPGRLAECRTTLRPASGTPASDRADRARRRRSTHSVSHRRRSWRCFAARLLRQRVDQPSTLNACAVADSGHVHPETSRWRFFADRPLPVATYSGRPDQLRRAVVESSRLPVTMMIAGWGASRARDASEEGLRTRACR